MTRRDPTRSRDPVAAAWLESHATAPDRGPLGGSLLRERPDRLLNFSIARMKKRSRRRAREGARPTLAPRKPCTSVKAADGPSRRTFSDVCASELMEEVRRGAHPRVWTTRPPSFSSFLAAKRVAPAGAERASRGHTSSRRSGRARATSRWCAAWRSSARWARRRSRRQPRRAPCLAPRIHHPPGRGGLRRWFIEEGAHAASIEADDEEGGTTQLEVKRYSVGGFPGERALRPFASRAPRRSLRAAASSRLRLSAQATQRSIAAAARSKPKENLATAREARTRR